MFAPCSIGFNKAGVATVLSTIKGTFAFFEKDAIAFKSNTSNFGFPNDSTKNARVFSRTAASKFEGLLGSTKVVVIPKRGRVTLSKL